MNDLVLSFKELRVQLRDIHLMNLVSFVKGSMYF